MRVALFFDGKNFYRALDTHRATLEIDYDHFSEWIVGQVDPTDGKFVGAYYYTGHQYDESGPGSRLGKFLKRLSYQTGYFVRREPLVKRKTTCRHCKKESKYRAEKRVDVRLAADMIHFAAANAYDICVLFSGDQDFVPAVEAVQRLGKQVYVATWNRRGLSPELRTRCFGEINLVDGEGTFSTGKERKGRPQYNKRRATEQIVAEVVLPINQAGAVVATIGPSTEAVATPSASTDTFLTDLDRNVLAQLRSAVSVFGATGGHVAVWYFVNKWKGLIVQDLTPDEIQQSLDRLKAAGHVEEYAYTDKSERITPAIKIVSEMLTSQN